MRRKCRSLREQAGEEESSTGQQRVTVGGGEWMSPVRQARCTESVPAQVTDMSGSNEVARGGTPPPRNSLWTSLWPGGQELGQVKRQVPGQPREPLAGNNRWWWGQDSRQENEDHKRRVNSDVKAWSNQGVWASASACFHVRETL